MGAHADVADLETASPPDVPVEALLQAGPILLFDGVCNLCCASVRFVVKRDPRGVHRFAAAQSETGQRLLRHFGLPAEELTTMVLVEGEGCYTRSAAGLRVARRLRFPWPLFYAFAIVPAFLRDVLYRLIARNRYRWFGRKEACMVPTPDLRRRFV